MPIEMKSVLSANVSEIGYDDATSELVVRWNNGKTSIYSGVSPELAREVSNSWSIGQALNERIKGRYGHRYA